MYRISNHKIGKPSLTKTNNLKNKNTLKNNEKLKNKQIKPPQKTRHKICWKVGRIQEQYRVHILRPKRNKLRGKKDFLSLKSVGILRKSNGNTCKMRKRVSVRGHILCLYVISPIIKWGRRVNSELREISACWDEVLFLRVLILAWNLSWCLPNPYIL